MDRKSFSVVLGRNQPPILEVLGKGIVTFKVVFAWTEVTVQGSVQAVEYLPCRQCLLSFAASVLRDAS